jgi:CRISPR/Cas system-associated exonuclease Cas4 (RecB family)
MVKIKNEIYNPTLEAADRALEQESSEQRSYLGASTIGEYCERKLWYSYRWSKKIKFTAKTLKAFADGHYQEDLQALRLKKVKGVTIYDEQREVTEIQGHFKGHCDGIIKGILESPKVDHVWEHKSVGEKKFLELKKLLESGDEKKVLELWNEIYYAQAIIYMHLLKVKRHFLTVSSSGGRESLSVRTNADPKKAQEYLKKASRIIYSEEPPVRQESYRCNFCDFYEICKGEEIPDINCRTCLYSTPSRSGEWICGKHLKAIDRETQKIGCDEHLFIPDMINSEQIDAIKKDEKFEEIIYKIGTNKKGKGISKNVSIETVPRKSS